MIEKQFQRLTHEVRSCVRCELHQQRTQAVFGTGNPFAELMVIGEGPGEEEDKQGLPFVGKSGQLLDKILGAAGFSRQE
ncbi:MAG: uracil-DNA glycosylase, partial [Bacteroidales bacterium]